MRSCAYSYDRDLNVISKLGQRRRHKAKIIKLIAEYLSNLDRSTLVDKNTPKFIEDKLSGPG